MYLNHFHLSRKPFENTTNPRFFWFGDTFAEAHAALECGLREKKGLILLSGESGSGKTALLHAFIDTLGPEVSKAFVPDPDMDSADFFKFLATELDFKETFATKGDFLTAFRRHLKAANAESGKQILILIDEAQRASRRLLKDIGLLNDFGADDRTGVIIVLSGQTRIFETLAEPENTGLHSRFSVNIGIDRLTQSDTEKYIAHRLEKAGAQNALFTAGARAAVYQFTRGNPLQINNLCDRSLLTGYISEALEIDSGIVTECAAELGVSLDTNVIAADDAIQAIDSEKESVSSSPKRAAAFPPLKLILLAAIGAALIVLLRFSIISQNASEHRALEDHANATYEHYQIQLEITDDPVSNAF